MCGICGLLSLDGSPVDRDTVEAMNETLFHRGPDSGGTFVEGEVGLAARRLAIIDLAGGDQPIANEDGSVTVVQNGEIYNYRELQAEVEGLGHRMRTRCDTEVLLHLYEERGPHFVEALRGMFAIALWDSARKRLVLARDRFGIKPLYYSLDERSLAFGSELKALVARPGFSREVDRDALEAFLTFSFVPSPLTIFSAARKLPPGCLLVWEPETGVRVERYARPRPVPADEVRPESEEELAEELRSRLRDSVRAHLIADVPVGVLLSGGIDSSTLAAFAALESSGPVSTFSIGFDERGFDERDRARLIAERYETDHHELLLKPNVVELLPALAETFDEPFADSSAIPTYLVSKLAREHVKVALSGEGGDELFGGYNYYVGHVLARRLGAFAGPLRPLVERLPSSSSRASTFDNKAKRFVRGATLAPLERHLVFKQVFSEQQRRQLVRPELNGARPPLEYLDAQYETSDGAESLARFMHVDLGVYLVEDMLVKTDRASMAHSLEARVPILDTVVAELALALPSRLKVRGFSKKRLIRKAMEPLLPREILHGPKRGFSIPIAAWLRDDLNGFARETLSPSLIRKQGFFRPDAVTALLDAHDSRRDDYSRQLWALLVFSLWFERYGNGSGPG
jgi:asparagine synthase (glutamine-hydrolysing)